MCLQSSASCDSPKLKNVLIICTPKSPMLSAFYLRFEDSGKKYVGFIRCLWRKQLCLGKQAQPCIVLTAQLRNMSYYSRSLKWFYILTDGTKSLTWEGQLLTTVRKSWPEISYFFIFKSLEKISYQIRIFTNIIITAVCVSDNRK